MDNVVGADARERRPTVCYRHLSCHPFDRTDAVEMRSAFERPYVEMSGSIAGHDGLTLGTDERQFITGSADFGRSHDLRSGGSGEPAGRESGTNRAARENTSVKQMASGQRGILPGCPIHARVSDQWPMIWIIAPAACPRGSGDPVRAASGFPRARE